MKVSVRDEKDLIHNVLEILDSGRGWIKHTAIEGDRFCIAGAIYEAGAERGATVRFSNLRQAAYLRIRESIKRLFPDRPNSIPTFNDSQFTSWEDVQAVLEDAMK